MATIAEIYQSQLGRAPDAGGLEFWSGLLNSGAASIADIEKAINDSAEGKAFDTAVSAPAPAPVSAPAPAPIEQIYQSQLGRAPDAGGLDFWSGQLNSGSSLADIEAAINNSVEGQNYDSQALAQGYRENFGRNPEQEGYQFWMSQLQTNPTVSADQVSGILKSNAGGSDVATLSNGPFTAAQVAALDADPYAGRYATQSIYDLIADAANVSSINGKDVQFVTPVTQTPVVSVFDNGSFTARPGDYTLNPGQLAAQINTAVSSGAVSPDQYTQLMKDATDAASVEELLTAFNTPQATVNMGDGRQTGVNGADVDFGPIIANSYNGVDTRTTKDQILNNQNFSTAKPLTLNSAVAQLQAISPKFGQVTRDSFGRTGTFGASTGGRMSSGNANYSSDLIKTLRDTNQQNNAANAGFTGYGYTPRTVQTYTPSSVPKMQMAFDPAVLQQTPSTPKAPAETAPTQSPVAPMLPGYLSPNDGREGSMIGGGYSAPSGQTTAEQLASAGVTYGNLLGGMLPGGMAAGALGNAYIDSRLNGAALNGGYTGMYTGDAAFGGRTNNTATAGGTGPLSGDAWGTVDAALADALGNYL